MDWTLAQIKSKVRSLTGRPDTGQLLEQDLEDAINQQYRNVLPYEADFRELVLFESFDTAEGVDVYELDDSVLALRPPLTASAANGAAHSLRLYMDAADFFERFPDEASERSRPAGLLFFGRTLYLRPVPDGVYSIRYHKILRPEALADDDDKPLDPAWGAMIAYGAAVALCQEAGQAGDAARLAKTYAFLVNLAARRQRLQTPVQTRAMPRF